MGNVIIRDGVLHLDLTVGERLLALHRRNIEAPIASAVVVPEILTEIRGIRLPGAGIPGVIAVGTWRGRDGDTEFHDFVLAHHRGPGIVVTCAGGDYDRVLIGVDDPDRLLAEINA
jgi:hypothetical protein